MFMVEGLIILSNCHISEQIGGICAEMTQWYYEDVSRNTFNIR